MRGVNVIRRLRQVMVHSGLGLLSAVMLAACGLSGEPPTIATLPPTQPVQATVAPIAGQPTSQANAVDPHAVLTQTAVNPPQPTSQVSSANPHAALTGTPPAGTPQPTLLPVQGSVVGKVTNGTAGAAAPAGIKVTLHTLDMTSQGTKQESTTDAEGNFIFPDVSISAVSGFGVTVQHQGRTFSSELVMGDAASKIVTVPVTIYDVTLDPKAITVNTFTMQINVIEGQLQVVHVMRVDNTTDRVYSTDQRLSDGRYVSLALPLPVGAVPQNVDSDPTRYALAEDGSAYYDTQPVTPGEHRMHILYSIPFRDGGLLFERRLPYKMQTDVQILIDSESVQPVFSVNGGLLDKTAVQDMASGKIVTYSAAVSLEQGALLRFELKGGSGVLTFPRELFVGGLVGGGLGLIVIGTIMLLRSMRTPTRRGARS